MDRENYLSYCHCPLVIFHDGMVTGRLRSAGAATDADGEIRIRGVGGYWMDGAQQLRLLAIWDLRSLGFAARGSGWSVALAGTCSCPVLCGVQCMDSHWFRGIRPLCKADLGPFTESPCFERVEIDGQHLGVHREDYVPF